MGRSSSLVLLYHGVDYGPETGHNLRVALGRFQLREGERFFNVYDFGA